MQVKIIIRDVNGKQTTITSSWNNVCAGILDNRKKLDAQEILLVMVDNTCIYSRLANYPIGWEELIRFFA